MPSLDGISSPAFALPLNPGQTPEAKAARTKEMAREFEATFVSMLIKEMRQSSEGEDGFFPGDSSDIQGGLFDLYLGRHLADAGGIGIAEAITRPRAPFPAATAPNPTLAPTNGLVPRPAAGGPVLRPPGR